MVNLSIWVLGRPSHVKTTPRAVLNSRCMTQSTVTFRLQEYELLFQEGTAMSTLVPGLKGRTFCFGIWTQLTT